MISMIAAMSKNRVIGVNNDLPWHISADLKYFKEKTLAHPIIYGRKTFDSFGGRVLPGRTNIILSRNTQLKVEGAHVVSSLVEAIELAKKSPGAEEIFICGGEQIYKLALEQADRIYLTLVDVELADGHSFFPNFSETEFVLRDSLLQKGEPEFSWQTFERSPSS